MINRSLKLTNVKKVEEGIFIKKLIQLTWWKSLSNFLKIKRFKNEIRIAKYLSEQPLKFFVVPFIYKTDNSSFLQMKKITGQYLKNTIEIVPIKNIALGLLEFNHYNYSSIFSNYTKYFQSFFYSPLLSCARSVIFSSFIKKNIKIYYLFNLLKISMRNIKQNRSVLVHADLINIQNSFYCSNNLLGLIDFGQARFTNKWILLDICDLAVDYDLNVNKELFNIYIKKLKKKKFTNLIINDQIWLSMLRRTINYGNQFDINLHKEFLNNVLLSKKNFLEWVSKKF